MHKTLTWTKNFFSSDYQLFEGNTLKNSVLFENLKNDARVIGATSYFFKTAGFANPITKICNENHEVIGMIHYHHWQTKAIVTLHKAPSFTFQFTNTWHNKWMVTDFKEKQIFYEANSNRGMIHSNTDDELLLLTGLFISAYYTRILFICMLVILIPIIIGIN